jgi:Uma2 family endonuclease
MEKQQAQLKPQTGVAFLISAPRKATQKKPPKIVWEIPPPDFYIPDEPMDNFEQSLLAEALRYALSCAQHLSPNQLCATSLAVCVKVGGRTITKAPDWFYVPYVYPTEKNRRSYTPIAEGKLPTLVMEFLSDNKRTEYDKSPIFPYGKWYFYEKILQVAWYVIFDSSLGKLEVYRLEGGHYKRQSSQKNGHYWIDSLKLFLGVWEGLKEDVMRKTFWLRWWDAESNQLPWQYENAKQLEIEKQEALEKAEIEKREALEKAEIEKREALEKAESEKREALEKAKQIAKNETTRQIAKQMLQVHAEIAFIAQVTGLDEAEILLLNIDKSL